jgi:hypothetical protein
MCSDHQELSWFTSTPSIFLPWCCRVTRAFICGHGQGATAPFCFHIIVD